ncbi:MAG: ATP-binding cassette domain-containing protein [Gammaproteobacteria bacterium]
MGDIDDEEVICAAKLAGLHDMILHFPQGYDTEVTPLFSAGQKQRLALARALYQNPCLLVLDEPNANLDTQGELALQQALKYMRDKGSAILVISHRIALLQQVDYIIILQAGQIKVTGPRDKVLTYLQEQQNEQASY